MPHIGIFDIIGYVGSILITVSIMMKSIIRLRIINLCGALSLTIYALVIKAYPIVLMDSVIVMINLYYLYEMFSTKEYFKLLEVNESSDYLKYFIEHHMAEIHKYMPDYKFERSDNQYVYFILRNMIPAGLFIVEKLTVDTIFVKLDFVIPGYRDFKIGQFVYKQNADRLKSRGISKIFAEPCSDKHKYYLAKMGFQAIEQNGKKLYLLQL